MCCSYWDSVYIKEEAGILPILHVRDLKVSFWEMPDLAVRNFTPSVLGDPCPKAVQPTLSTALSWEYLCLPLQPGSVPPCNLQNPPPPPSMPAVVLLSRAHTGSTWAALTLGSALFHVDFVGAEQKSWSLDCWKVASQRVVMCF